MKFTEYTNEKPVTYMIDSTTNIKDSMLDGFSYEELIDAVYHNEKKHDEKSIKKIFKEIMNDQIKNAEFLLKSKIHNIISILDDIC